MVKISIKKKLLELFLTNKGFLSTFSASYLIIGISLVTSFLIIQNNNLLELSLQEQLLTYEEQKLEIENQLKECTDDLNNCNHFIESNKYYITSFYISDSDSEKLDKYQNELSIDDQDFQEIVNSITSYQKTEQSDNYLFYLEFKNNNLEILYRYNLKNSEFDLYLDNSET